MQKDLKKKIVKVLLVGALAIMPLFPYHIYADTITSANVVGYSVYYEQESIDGYTSAQTSYYNYVGNFHFVFEFDEAYLGYFTISAYVDSYHYYYGSNPPTFGTKRTYASGTYYINGNSCEIIVPAVLTSARNYGFLDDNSTIHENPVISYNYSINSSNVTPMASLSTLDDVVDVLMDIHDDVSIDVMTELETIVTDLGIANNYLQTLSELRQYTFPVESLNAVSLMEKYNSQYRTDLFSNGYWTYPVYNIIGSRYLFDWSTYISEDSYYILFCRYLSNSNYSNFIHIEDGTISNIRQIAAVSVYVNDTALQCYRITFRATGSANVKIKTVGNFTCIPVYLGLASNKHLTTDFALNFGLTNNLLDNLNIIAQGTQQSNQSGNDLENSAADISTNSNTMFQFENQQNTNMNNALQSINTNFDIGNIGSSFLTSAAWVKTQFDNLTNTTPFGSVLSFSLLLGIALLIIGKVYK